MEPGYTLVITEKPDAGRRIASALGKPSRISIGGVEAHEVRDSFNGEHYVVCSAAGHLYGVSDPSHRSEYPIFDVAWLPLDVIFSKKRKAKSKYSRLSSLAGKRIKAIKSLSKNAKRYIHACDYDLEGETIGANILKFACGEPPLENCMRAKFSTLTNSEVRESFSKLEEIKESLSTAGRSRHVIDYIWGINLSRALVGAYTSAGKGYRNLSVGRVQGPSLSFVADKELEIKTHVPVPFWNVLATLRTLESKSTFEAQYERKNMDIKSEADAVLHDISNARTAMVKSLHDSVIRRGPPFPFNLGDLQTECFKRLKISPSITLKIAEKLYLSALISYPRTNSQKLPEAIGYSQIIEALSRNPTYEQIVLQVRQRGRKFPCQGQKEDAAHPAIYPTGDCSGRLTPAERGVYDLIVRRFLACFGEDAILSETNARILIEVHNFEARGTRVVREGWMRIYPLKGFREDAQSELPELKVSQILDVASAKEQSEFRKKPPRYTQSSLLHLMEQEGIGTKSTRSEILGALIEREYVRENESRSLEATDIGIELVKAMREHCPEIMSTDLTRRMEAEVEEVSIGSKSELALLSHAKSAVSAAVEKIRNSEAEIGGRLCEAETQFVESRPSSGKCPICIDGSLRIIKSPRSGKRFLGCSNYAKSRCTASAPLPQRGRIKVQTRTCPSCKWPLVSIFYRPRRTPWVICPNLNCNSRSVNS